MICWRKFIVKVYLKLHMCLVNKTRGSTSYDTPIVNSTIKFRSGGRYVACGQPAFYRLVPLKLQNQPAVHVQGLKCHNERTMGVELATEGDGDTEVGLEQRRAPPPPSPWLNPHPWHPLISALTSSPLRRTSTDLESELASA
jgi:hypothetical protein